MTTYVDLSDDVLAHLGEGTRTAHVSYLARDGRPLAAPVWFVIEDRSIVFATGRGTAKGRALARDPRIALTVDVPAAPYGFVQIQGVAEFDERRDVVRRITTACGRRYMGADRAEEFGARNADENEIVVRVRPIRVISNLDVTA